MGGEIQQNSRRHHQVRVGISRSLGTVAT